MAEFDREWEIVLERAKRDKTITGVHDMLHKWRHLAYRELKDPGAYYRLLATLEQAARRGRGPEGSVPGFEVTTLIGDRLGRRVG
ncbi:hypothetical protein SAMN05421810_104339 [Amycolatopsis arida]|uniref:Uncharacterized protein n=1 Tax=Amycolatopsis arida TaxID=587909 RepID=A0A1I5VF36_9PSEU|nr:DUF6247 family protein [Amycolatopsis arida]TDX91255.1 hypothetical protein CLV69_106338 [Amycolatopsis arida]SFQ05957.1 hypothetical protein SAMN05421810_104339 [Amycolatopsis arida]